MAQEHKKKDSIRDDLIRIQPLPDERTGAGATRDQAARVPEERAQGRTAQETGIRLGERAAIFSRLDAPGRSRDELDRAVVGLENQRDNQTIASGWLTRDYLGPEVYGRFAGRPVRTLTEPPSYFTRFEAEMGFRPTGVHEWGTDEIRVSSAVRFPSERRELITHEDLHYASELGGGLDIRIAGAGGAVVDKHYIRWFHEGMTELHAQQLARTHGNEPLSISYPYETAASFYIQMIVMDAVGGDPERGREILRDAYLTGDFTAVGRLVDMRLGEGAFGRFLDQRNGAEAYRFIRSALGSRFLGFEGCPQFTSWGEDPMLRNVTEPLTASERFRSLLSSPRRGQQ